MQMRTRATVSLMSVHAVQNQTRQMGVVQYSFSQKQPFRRPLADLSRAFARSIFLTCATSLIQILFVSGPKPTPQSTTQARNSVMFSPCVRWLDWLLACKGLPRMKACSCSFFETRSRAFHRSPSGQLPSRAMWPCAFLSRAFHAPFAKIRSATSSPETVRWTLMDSDTNVCCNTTGSTFVLRAAGLATLHEMPARVSFQKLGRESRNNPAKTKRYECATVQLCHATREVVRIDFRTFREPFAALSRAFARSVFASCVPVLLYI